MIAFFVIAFANLAAAAFFLVKGHNDAFYMSIVIANVWLAGAMSSHFIAQRARRR